jgi:hypothetical protein
MQGEIYCFSEFEAVMAIVAALMLFFCSVFPRMSGVLAMEQLTKNRKR